MRTSTGLLGTMSRQLVVVMSGVALFAPSTLVAAPATPATHAAVGRTASQLRLSLPVKDGVSAVGGRVESAMMISRFRVVVTDRSGATMSGVGYTGDWVAIVLLSATSQGSATARPLLRLTRRADAFVLPRPLGVRLDAGDSIELRVVTSDLPQGAELHLLIDYEAGAGVASRLAVSPFSADLVDGVVPPASLATNAPVVEWYWIPDVGGRLLAVAGSPLVVVRELWLEDAATDERLWSVTLRDAQGRSVFGQSGDVVRLGAAVQAGRTYRLRATLWSPAAEWTREKTLVALVLPSEAR